MKYLIFAFYFGVLVYAKPSHPINHGLGAIYKGPNSETIIQGPDGSIITAEADGGSVAVDGYGGAASAAAVATSAAAAHQIVQHSSAAAAATSHTLSLAQAPILVQEQAAVVAQPVVVAAEPLLVGRGRDSAVLDGPSGSILRHGEDTVISGPASTTIREGNLIASIPKPELNTLIVKPGRALVAPAAALVPAVGIPHGPTVAVRVNANLINEAHLAEVNRAKANAIAYDINAQAAIAEANRVGLIRNRGHYVAPQVSVAEVNAINAANLAHSQEAIARANLEAQANFEAVHLAHAATPQVAFVDVNAARIAQSQELAAKANFEAQLIQSNANAVNSAIYEQNREAIARANLEAQLAAERNSIAAQVALPLNHGLNPIITQGSQLISDAIVSSTPAPVVEVTPIVSSSPRYASVVVPGVSSTPGYLVKTSPLQNVIVSSTVKPVFAPQNAIVTPVAAANQVVYQSSSSKAESHSSSSVNVAGGSIIAAPVVASSDLGQWQRSFANNQHAVGESVYSSNLHRGVFH